MGRKALFTEAEVFAKADEMTAQGLDVSAISLVRELGGGSLGTMQKHSDKWHATKEKSEATHIAEMPEPIRNLFNSLWKAMEAETSKKLSRYHEYCDSEIQRYMREAQESGAYAVGLERENEHLEKTVQELRDTTATKNALVQELRGRVEQLEATISTQQQKFHEHENQLRAELKAEREQRLSEFSAANSAEQKLAAEAIELKAMNKNLSSTLAKSEEKLAVALEAELAAREAGAVLRGRIEQLQGEQQHSASRTREQKRT